MTGRRSRPVAVAGRAAGIDEAPRGIEPIEGAADKAAQDFEGSKQ